MNKNKVANKRFSLLLLSIFIAASVHSQTYILNEDFSSATGTTPPSGWLNNTNVGDSDDLWHFDNPVGREVNYPVTGSFAIFDSEGYSRNQMLEDVTLETPFFDATISANILCSFDHYFVGGNGATGTIEVFDGENWQVMKAYTDTTANSEKEILDISSYAGGVPNAKLRFRWEGDSIGYWGIDNLSIYTPMPTDAGITVLNAPAMPFPAGTHPIEVTLANFGANTLTSTTIQWSVNGVEQTPYSWTGSLTSGMKESNINIGSYAFVSGQKTAFKIWQSNPNGESDGYALNDTLQKTLYTALCGTYTVGGVTPDFENFTEVATALNNAGVACPVIFDIRDGIYDEQIKLYEISGASATNTITFRGESGDSSLVELHYQTSNPSNDFTLAITGSDYISFEDMSVLRTNGTYSVLIQNESNNVRFEHCRLGHVLSPNTSVDANLTFRWNNMEGYDLNLQHPDNTSAGEVIIENNYLRHLTITNSGPVSVKGNGIANVNGYAQNFTINRSSNIILESNRLRRLHFNLDTLLIVKDNNILRGESWDEDIGVLFSSCISATIESNTINVTSGYRSRALECINSREILVSDNDIELVCGAAWGKCISITGAASLNIQILGNSIMTSYYSNNDLTQHGIYIDNGDSIYVKHNIIDGLSLNKAGHGISLYNITNVVEADSNIVRNYQTTGIITNSPAGSQWKIRNNTITNVRDRGIYLQGTGGLYTNNTINGVIAGNGVIISASDATVSESRFLNVQAGTGIIVNGANNLVANNFVESEGVGIAKGISLQENGSGSKIVFNSINITGTDVANGVGLEVLGGNNYIVKNNIFANNGGGYASYFADSLKGVFDYNNYYSTKQKYVRFIDTDITNFSNFQTLSGQETNGFAKNPFYSSDSLLQMNQVLLNDAAEIGTGITTDIDANLRGLSPDFGALEYTPCAQDAGVNEFVGLVNPLSVGSQNVNVELQNQGTNVLTSATIHWEVNGVVQTPFNWSGSLAYRMNAEVTIGTYSFAGGESYKLKAWTENPNGGADCNIYNDTAKAYDMATPMCGIYTIGGTDPDFTNFTDAAIALNNAGITCPVIFEVRDGVYDEQIKLYEISGASATNTITFRGESGDSSLVELHYQTSNPSNDFTLAITGSDYISFEDMSVLRTNGTYSVLIQNESNNVRFEHCRLGHVLSPNTSVDANLTFRWNNMEGYDLNLQHPDNTSAGEVIIENNYLRHLTITNSGPVSVKGNGIANVNGYAQNFTINRSSNIILESNRLRRLHFNLDTLLIVKDNNILRGESWDEDIGVLFSSCISATIESNTINVTSGYRSRALECINSREILVSDNDIELVCGAAWGKCISITGAASLNIQILGNSIMTSYYSNNDLTQHGIYIDNGDSIYVKHNIIDGLSLNKAGHGISLYNITNVVEADSNIVRNYQTTGIITNSPAGSQWKIRNNTITNVRDRGIYLQGTGGLYTNNTINGVIAGNGVIISASDATVSESRFLNVQAGTGIIVNGANNLVANNFVESEGVGIAKGISLQENGSGSKIVFNSINITGTDVANGVGLEVLGGNNYIVKNNIFANNGGGYASYFADSLKGVFDYNNYYSTKQKYVRFIDTDITNFSNFQTLSGQETNGFAKNPFYSSDSLLQMNQVLLNDAAEIGTGITTDIDANLRGLSPDFGALEYTPCAQDAGVNEFVGLVNPLSVGSQNVNVELQNQGTNVLTSATIHWEVNGVVQTPFNWSGSLAYRMNAEVTIGTYSFAGGESYKLKAWTENPNGGADCNIYNDTAKAYDMATPMCGIYTIGGTDPDFTNFTDAAIALNNAGITCPVIFEVRDGVYDEQIKLYEISGAVATNTITFRGESGDSSLVELHYQTSNPSNDFTLAITGSDYISFEDMSVLRTNGTYSVLIQNESNNVRFEHCRLGHVLSPNTSVDANLTFRWNNMEGYDLNLQHPDNTSAGEVIIENNYLRHLTITNSGPVSVKGNGIANVNGYAQNFTINRSSNIILESNRLRRLHFNLDTLLIVKDNNILRGESWDEDIGVLFSSCISATIESNTINVTSGYRSRALECINSREILVSDNDIELVCGAAWGKCISITGAASLNIQILGNSIMTSYYSNNDLTQHGIYIDNGDSIYVKHNIIDGLSLNKAGHGISLYNITNVVEADSNIVRNYQTTGIITNSPAGSQWKIRNNTITNVRDRGIYLQGTGGLYTNNTINGVIAGNGVIISASDATVSESRFLNVQAGTGIIVNGANNLVANNFVESEGVGIAKGISLQENGSGSKIVFNSINITGTDVTNGIGLEVIGGTNYTVKNNIFANKGGGLAAKLDLAIAGSDWDYNDFYSAGDEFGSYLGTLYSDLGSWGASINADANSKQLNPFFQSDTALRPTQRALNGAGIAAANITLDIDGELRNLAAPDVGADEYLVDFGITRLLSPTLSCGLGTSDSVTVLIRQFGDVPFQDLEVAYQINGGPVNTGTVPGQTTNDIQYTFPTSENLAGHGTYNFKIWLVGSHDDNINNDTLEVARYSSDVPDVDFTYTADCAGTDIPFFGSATVVTGSIESYEWIFSDGDTATVMNPLHQFYQSGTYDVTLRAYTDVGCYGDITKEVDLLSTPVTDFTFTDACFEEEVSFQNNSTVESGMLTYNWSFGDGNTSSETNPSNIYPTAGKYNVQLTASASSGCSSTASDTVEMYSQLFPNISSSTDTAWVNITGGTPPYLVSWESGGSGEQITGLNEGWESVTISDANGCSVIDSVEIVIPELQFIIHKTDASCGTCNDGEIWVEIIEGVGPFFIQWSSGSTSDTASSVASGWHYLTIRDAFLKAYSDSIYVDGTTSILLTAVPNHLSCYQSFDGSIDLNITGGNEPYNIVWSNGDITEDVTGLIAGTYKVIVEDFNGTKDSLSIELTEPEPLVLNPAVQLVTCGGDADGSIVLSPDGGTFPYTYQWNDGSTGASLTSISEGRYSVITTDANGCTANDTFDITSTSTLQLNLSTYDVSCNSNCNGAAVASGAGGSYPYTIDWSNGNSGIFQFSLCPADYTVTVTDASGCSKDSAFTINEPDAISLTINHTDVGCGGANDGEITTTTNGGTQPYTYSWNTGDTTQNLTDIGGGIYNVTVADNNGCSKTAIAIVAEPDSIVIESNVTNPLCSNESNGAIDLTVSGGTAPYNYLWNGGYSAEDLNNLPSGSYTITVTDATGCSKVENIELTDPPALSVNFVSEDLKCSGSSDGQVTALVSGGTAPYSYDWSNTNTTETISGLTAGKYTVTIADVNGCSTLDSVSLSEPEPLNVELMPVNPVCEGVCNGSVSSNVTGGTAPYTFLWDNGETSANINDLCAGVYALTVTDANGCTFSDSVEISWITAVTGLMAVSDVTCAGMCNGFAIVTGSGGDGAYSYLWNDGSNASFRSNLCSGTYSVTVSDGQGCSTVLTDTILQPAPITITGVVTDAPCKGETGGTIDLDVSGGTPEYSYFWNNGKTSGDISDIAAGNYIVSVLDLNGCNQSASFNVKEPLTAPTATGTVSHVSCSGANDGSVTLTPDGGTAPYSYSWSDGSTQQNLSSVIAGNYEVTLTDANGCSFTSEFSITEPDPLSLNSTVTKIQCFGEATGAIDILVSGGTAPYSYSWSDGEATMDRTTLTAGTYQVTVTDGNGCILTEQFEVTQPLAALTATGTVSHVSCSGANDGSVTLTPDGGTAPYSYSWSDGSTLQNLSSVIAGNYEVTLIDANGCSFTSEFSITEPDPLSLNSTVTEIQCYGEATGAIDILVSGGTAPYAYSWNDGEATMNRTNLTAGTYLVTVTDASGCIITEQFEVTQPLAALTATGTVSHVSCSGANDGSVTLTPDGGTAPYSYSWSDGSTLQNLSSVIAGNYEVTLTDANGCSFTSEFSITEPDPLSLNSTVTEIQCFGEATGAIDILVSGGTAPYAYSWNDGESTMNRTTLTAGTYQVTVTDGNGCMLTEQFEVTQPLASLTATGTVSHVSCSGANDGSVALTPDGGTAPYSYSWSDGSTLQNLSSVIAGNYEVTLTDANGCSFTSEFSITEPDPLSLNSTVTEIQCYGEATGAIDILVSGGTAPYAYSWNDGEATMNRTNLTAGTYLVTVTDASGCIITEQFEVAQPLAALTATGTVSHVSCSGANDGSVALTPDGGTAPYSYIWSDGSTQQNLSSVIAGNYEVILTDANGCSFTSEFSITEPDPLSLNSTVTEIQCFGEATGAIDILVTGGTAPYAYSWSDGESTMNRTALTTGTYQVTVTDGNGCILTEQFEVTQPLAALTATGTVSHVSCSGANDGSVALTPDGGTAPYSYIWSDGSTQQNLSSVIAGNYEVTLTDANGCSFTSEFSITEPDPLSLNSTVTEIQCFGEATGAIDILVTGGTTPYAYSWNDGESTMNRTTLTAGTYQVTVTDGNGCMLTEQFEVTQPLAALTATGTVSHVSCSGANDGSVTLTPDGGTAPYSYSWSDGSTLQNLSSVIAGNYEVTLTDANGCEEVIDFNVSEPEDELVITAEVENISCSGEYLGSIKLDVAGGMPPYSYDWDNGFSENEIWNQTEGSYAVSITDDWGCVQHGNWSIRTQNYSSISGNAWFSKGTITADEAEVRLLDASSGNYKEIAVQRIGDQGSFEFNNLTNGQYVVFVKLDNHAKQKYPGVMHSYYNETFKWKEAQIIDLACEDAAKLVLNMAENPSAETSNGKVSGKISYMGGLLKATNPPAPDITVILVNALTGEAVTDVFSDSSGYYEIEGINPGSYSLHVDIPGYELKDTYHFNISQSNLIYDNLDFIIDSNILREIMKVNTITTISPQEIINDIRIYPNPARTYTVLQSSYLENQRIELKLMTNTGATLKQIKEVVRGDQIQIDISDLKKAVYIIEIKIEDERTYKQLIVM